MSVGSAFLGLFDATRRRISAPTTDLGRLLSMRPTEQGLLRRKALQSKGRDSQTFTAGAGERGKRRMSRRPRAATQRARNIGDPRRKTGIPKGLAPGRRFGYFLDEEKVTRRRPTHGGNKIVLPCRIAAQHDPS